MLLNSALHLSTSKKEEEEEDGEEEEEEEEEEDGDFNSSNNPLFNLSLKKPRITIRQNFPLKQINPLNPELNPIYYLLALLGAQHFLHVSRIMVK